MMNPSSPENRQEKALSPPPWGELEFRRLLEGLPAGAYTCDRNGLITYFNTYAAALWGRSPKLNDPVDRFCGSFKLFLADGTPITHDQCWMARALELDSGFNGEEILIERPDGSRITALAHANPIHDESGALIGAVNVLVDISDRKIGENAAARLAAIVESSDDAIVSKTLEGRILSWNAGAERILGYRADEMIGQSITRIIPRERLYEEEAILARLRRGESICHYETVRLRKDGRLIDLSLTISPVRDSAGRIIGASKIARDISEQVEARQALVALKDELATQLADLRRLHAMSTRLSTTLDLEPILDETLATALAIENTYQGLLLVADTEQGRLTIGASVGFKPDFHALLQQAPAGETPCGLAFQERRRVIIEDTETDPFFAPYRQAARDAGFRAVHCTPLLTRSGMATGVLAMHFPAPHRPTDRTIHLIDLCARQAVEYIESARLYAELKAADQSKDEFLAVLAHELRNPLAPIRNSLHILRLSGELTPSGERVHDVMERQVNHLVRLVDDLLEISRISRGKIELRREPIELAAIIRSAVETSRPLIEDAGHQLAISLPTEPLTLDADGVRLAQIVANLLNNAAKYTPPGGQIWLGARREADEIVISVRDTGIGIATDKLPRVFDMFAQIQSPDRPTAGGLGIGLTLVKRLTEMHGGSVAVQSEGAGKGSEFTVRLPLPAVAEQPATSRPKAKERSAPLVGRRVLVVDDNRDAADSMGMFLKFLGAKTHVAYDGPSALAAMATFGPDVVLLDIGMPGMDGYEVARRIRRQPEHQGVLLLAMTGWGQEEDRRRTAEAGFDHHLVKPVDPLALQTLLVTGSAGTKARPGGVPPSSVFAPGADRK